MKNKLRFFPALALLLITSVVGCTQSYTQEDLDAARDEAYAGGHEIGYDAGSHDSYKLGYAEGYDAGAAKLAELKLAKQEASKLSYDKGYEFGYEQGKNAGYSSGYQKGKSEGYDTGYTVGYTVGYKEGEDFGYAKGWSIGYDSGYDREPLPHRYVGSVYSNIYHYPWCVLAKQIKPENEIWFESAEDALSQGYTPDPDKDCNPPGE